MAGLRFAPHAGVAYDFTYRQQFGGGTAAPPWGFRTTAKVRPEASRIRGATSLAAVRSHTDTAAASFTPFASFCTFSQIRHATAGTCSRGTSASKGRSRRTGLASASYMGSSTVHLWALRALNNAIYFPGSPVNGICTAQGYVFRPPTGTTCSTTANTNQRRRLYLGESGGGTVSSEF